MKKDYSQIDDKYINEIKVLLDNSNDVTLRELVYKLIDERNEFKKMALEDELTKTGNRRIIQNNSLNYDAVVMCDVDDFKFINDEFGHSVGDKLLELVSTIIRKNIRKFDLICRYGGDEFVIIFRKCKIENAIRRMEVIRKNISELEDVFDIPITTSFGVAEYECGKPIKDALEEADMALYESKRAGKDKITVYSKKLEK